jgi:hypothetical protein
MVKWRYNQIRGEGMKRTLCLFIALVLLAGSLYCQDEESEMKTLILAQNTRRSSDITFLKRINMGMPGGDNWLVERTTNRPGEDKNCVLFLYVINGSSIIQEENLGLNFDVSEYTSFDIMQNIPGTQIENGSCVIYDYNGDGFDEVFNYGFYGRGYFVRITGYNPEKEDIVDYADIPFQIIDRDRGPAPVEFVTYKGMKGFKVYYFVGEVGGGPGFIPNPSPKNHRWFFYAWDEGQREFVEIEEFVEEINSDYLVETSVGTAVSEDFDIAEIESMKTFALGKSEKRTQSKLSSDSGNSRFIFYIAIAVGVTALALALFFAVRRKKR